MKCSTQGYLDCRASGADCAADLSRPLTFGKIWHTTGEAQDACTGGSQAQTGTEEALGQLSRQAGGPGETVGGDLEDTAYIVLHEVLNRELGWQVEPLERVWQTWGDEPEEVGVFGRARAHLEGEVFPVCFCYRARPEVQEDVRASGMRLVLSYGKLV